MLTSADADGDYIKWTAVTTTPSRQGLNQIEAQLRCFPSGKVSTPNLITHLVHNVTGLPVVGILVQPPSPHSALLPPLKTRQERCQLGMLMCR